MKTQFVANDGKIFDTEDKCKIYEDELNKKIKEAEDEQKKKEKSADEAKKTFYESYDNFIGAYNDYCIAKEKYNRARLLYIKKYKAAYGKSPVWERDEFSYPNIKTLDKSKEKNSESKEKINESKEYQPNERFWLFDDFFDRLFS